MTAASEVAPPGLEESSTDGSGAVEVESSTTESTQVLEVPNPGEVYLSEMLATMDHQLRCLRETQQRLVSVVELACRRALGSRFGRLVLVGSVALCAETPGSDVDVVCFTREPDSDSAPSACLGNSPAEGHLRKTNLRKVLEQLASITDGQCMNALVPGYSMEFFEDARVPILRISWGLPDQSLAIDVLMDQRRPLDHVRWFQAVHACPRPSAPLPLVTPLVTVSLRCVKWWLRQRQIPRTKEGGLPTIAWLLMALHTCSLPETRKEVGDQGPMAALASSLRAFFTGYSSPGSLHGVLQFGSQAIGDAEDLPSDFRPSSTKSDSPWADLVVLDPTQRSEDLNLAPSLMPATQLLLIHELQRAAGHLQAFRAASSPPREESELSVKSAEQAEDTLESQSEHLPDDETRHRLEDLFEGLPPIKNSLPAMTTESLAALLLQGNPSKGVGSIEVALIDRIVPRQGWSAPFLHRSDTTSELYVRLCDVSEGTGSCQPRREGGVVLCPCHFVCMVALERNGLDAGRYKLGKDDLQRYRSMRQILSELRTHQRALGDLNPDLNSPSQHRSEPKVAFQEKSRARRSGRKAKKKTV